MDCENKYRAVEIIELLLSKGAKECLFVGGYTTVEGLK